MSRQLLRCSSLRTHLKETIFNPRQIANHSSPVLVFTSKSSRSHSGSDIESNCVNDFWFPGSDSVRTTSHRNVDLRLVTISSHYPTREDVREAQRLVDESGATTVLGVGSGAVMDIVKFLDIPTPSSEQHAKTKILIPGTSAAVFAANTSFSLILDRERHLMWTKPCSSTCTSTTVAQPGTVVTSAYTDLACRTFLIDACYRAPERLVELELAKLAVTFDPTLDGAHTTAIHVEGGLTESVTRSAPIALAVALCPTFFPKASIFHFFAALLPGMASLYGKTLDRQNQYPHLSDLVDGPVPSVQALMEQLLFHQEFFAVNKSNNVPVKDVPVDKLEQILSTSLSRDSN